MILPTEDFQKLNEGRHPHPHQVLGLHPTTVEGRAGLGGWAMPLDATACVLVELDKTGSEVERHPMGRTSGSDLFECFLEGRKEPFPYRLRVTTTGGEVRQSYHPYAAWPSLSEDDIYLINQGNHHHIYEKLGGHPHSVDGVSGYRFAVWAPSAKAVSIVGDFNRWQARFHPMRSLGSSGIWELFIPGVEAGHKYKYRIIGPDGHERLKTDPYAAYYEAPPHNAAITWNPGANFAWKDDAYLKRRRETNWDEAPVSIYEVHFGSWKRVVEDGGRPFTYREMAYALADYCTQMHFTHVEFMPLAEHPFDGSWGYQVTGFFAPTHRFGEPEDFMFLVDYLHQHDIGVIIDWVPAHFPRDAFALAEFDGTHLYEHADPRQGAHQDWGTLIFNYGRHEVRNFLIGSALCWFERYHIDGLRVDAVASMLYLDYSRKHNEWIPNKYGGRENLEAIDFIRQANDLVHQYYPAALMIAEESTAFGGVTKPTSDWGLGFNLKWNMGWMHDTLQYIKNDPIHRKYHHNELTFGMLYQYSEKFTLVFSHDEVVHGKSSMIVKMGCGADIGWKAHDLRTLYAMMWAWPGKKTLFMSSEIGQGDEWRYDQSVQWHLLQYPEHSGVQLLVRDLNKWLTESGAALAKYDFDPKGFEWINGGDYEQSILSFVRYGDDETDTTVFVANFTPVNRDIYRFGVPFKGRWKEVLNTNASCYNGTGHGNFGGVITEDEPWDGREQSIEICLPGLSALFFQYAGEPELSKPGAAASITVDAETEATSREPGKAGAAAPAPAASSVNESDARETTPSK
ncbi:MAG: 1,4-alpha-glucan branching protein GlgB [Opitutales bacterium]